MCADLFLYLTPSVPLSDEEEHLFEFFYYFLLSSMKSNLSNDSTRTFTGFILGFLRLRFEKTALRRTHKL